jgi:uncharacterized protein YceH (UPF0502 family)
MKILLNAAEARVIGALIEKQISTPDQYPLSLNALVIACNQKSNRDPVLNLDEAVVQQTVDALARKHLVVEKSGFGSRVPKYQHRFCNTEYGTLRFSEQELGILCELLLRGAQTPGELRTRAARLAPFSDVTEVEATLERLANREDGPFIVRLPREAGRRDSRYTHLFCGEVVVPPQPESVETPSIAPTAMPAARTSGPDDLLERLERLESQVHALALELTELRRRTN